MKREEAFLKNSAILSLGTFFPKLTSIITLPIITGCLTKADYGTFDIITVLASLFLPVATLQMQSAAFRFLVSARDNEEQQKEIITNIVLFTLPVCIIALIVLFFFLSNISNLTRLLILIYFFVDTLLITARQISRGLAKNQVYSISALVSSFFEMVLMYVFLSVLNGSLNSAIAALIIPQSVSLVYIIIRTKLCKFINTKLFSIKTIRSLITYSWPLIPNSLSSWVMRESDRLILAWFLGVEATAVYAVANKIPNMFNILQSTFSLSWQENASESVNDEDAGEYYGKMFNSIFQLFVGIMALLIAFTPVLFKVLIRGEYSEAYNHMPILFIAALFATVSSFVGGIYIANMKSKQIGLSTALAALTNFLINLLFVRRIGIYAASLSTLISYLWLAIYRMIDVQKIQKIKFDFIRIISLTLMLVGMAAICYLRNRYLDCINMVFALSVAAILNRKLILTVYGHLKKRI